jgi:hypothetical protein
LYRFIRFFSQKLCICIALNDTFLSIAAQHCLWEDGLAISGDYQFRKRVESGIYESVYLWEDGLAISGGYQLRKRVESGVYESGYLWDDGLAIS